MEAATSGQDTTETEAGPDKPPFSLELSQDQKDVRDWVRGFGAADRAPGRRGVG